MRKPTKNRLSSLYSDCIAQPDSQTDAIDSGQSESPVADTAIPEVVVEANAPPDVDGAEVEASARIADTAPEAPTPVGVAEAPARAEAAVAETPARVADAEVEAATPTNAVEAEAPSEYTEFEASADASDNDDDAEFNADNDASEIKQASGKKRGPKPKPKIKLAEQPVKKADTHLIGVHIMLSDDVLETLEEYVYSENRNRKRSKQTRLTRNDKLSVSRVIDSILREHLHN